MHPESQNHMQGQPHVGDTPPSAHRRVRSSLELVFQDVRLRTADAPTSQLAGLRESLRGICTDARRSGLRAEQLLVLIKDVWAGLPVGISRVQPVLGDERLNYVISTCVDEYYGDAISLAADAISEREATP